MSDPDNLLEGFVELSPFAAQMGRTTRTVRRWIDEPNGLPYTRLGCRILVHLPTAREWLLGRVKQRNPRRRSRNAQGAL
jgi:hypothetical protein